MGSQTFGKGSVQSVIPLPPDRQTAVKLTTARYYTPKGRSIQARGIVPDILVDEYADGDGLNSLRLREADLTKHLTNDKDANEISSKSAGLDQQEEEKLIAREKQRKPLMFGEADDFQLKQALNHLKGLPVQAAKGKAADVKGEEKPATDKK